MDTNTIAQVGSTDGLAAIAVASWALWARSPGTTPCSGPGTDHEPGPSAPTLCVHRVPDRRTTHSHAVRPDRTPYVPYNP
jgi:hypothetical protein